MHRPPTSSAIAPKPEVKHIFNYVMFSTSMFHLRLSRDLIWGCWFWGNFFPYFEARECGIKSLFPS